MSTDAHQPNRARLARWLRVGLVLASLASAVALVAMVQRAVVAVRSGHGLDTHHTFWLVEDNWLGFLVFVACVVVALLAGLLLRWVQRRHERLQWRELEQKQGGPNAGA